MNANRKKLSPIVALNVAELAKNAAIRFARQMAEIELTGSEGLREAERLFELASRSEGQVIEAAEAAEALDLTGSVKAAEHAVDVAYFFLALHKAEVEGDI